MIDASAAAGIDWGALRSLAKALLLPPMPWLALLLTGLALRARWPRAAALAVTLAVALLYLGTTEAMGRLMLRHLVQVPPPLPMTEVAALRQAPRTAIVVLGGGRRPAIDYGRAGGTLNARSLERLRYGVWLARQTGLPLAFSGGVGWGESHGPTEAALAAEIAQHEFGVPLRWREERSRDTAGNAVQTVALLRAQGIARIVLVTHNYHMPRAQAAFERAATGTGIAIDAAPTGTPVDGSLQLRDWLPSLLGTHNAWLAWHEWLGRRVAG